MRSGPVTSERGSVRNQDATGHRFVWTTELGEIRPQFIRASHTQLRNRIRDIAKWVEGQGLGEYAEAFANNKIDGDVLRSPTVDDLKEMGVAAAGDRRRLLRAIASLS